MTKADGDTLTTEAATADAGLRIPEKR
jgi:hypothetical protein